MHSPVASDNDMIFEGVELPSLLPVEKAARVLSISTTIVEQWIGEGRLETVRINGQVRVLTSSIEDRRGHKTTSLSNQEQD
ncbi:helix-turn-helix domain-containing protein [Candidatus Bipolaricaulota bacterium]